jgi:transposase
MSLQAIVKRCAGLDVHKKTVVVCVLLLDEGSGVARKYIRTFGTMTSQLLELADWLVTEGVTQVAMESTGVLWKPVFNILEGNVEKLLLVNAQHIKNVPGRKTDVKDSEWIAQLLQHGLLSPSFVPERPLRELRDLTRHRAQITSEKAREINRIHKVLEDANIKLGAVASDVMGVSGRAMLRALIEGVQSPQEMAELARKRLRGKIPQLKLALEGRVGEHHRFLLKMHYDHVLYLEGHLAQLTARIIELIGDAPELPPPDDPGGSEPGSDKKGQTRKDASTERRPVASAGSLSPLSLAAAARMIDEVPGIDVASAQDLLAEIGTDMDRFPTHKHLCSWACQCPGNHESAGKKSKGKRRSGNRWLSRVLSEMAWAASHTKETYLAAQFRRLARKRGNKRAIVAVGHTILGIVYHMLKYHRAYKDMGGDFFDSLEPARLTRYHIKRLESLGYKVELSKNTVAA